MAGAVSALFLLDIKGRVLIWRDYRGDVSAVQAERFFTKLIEKVIPSLLFSASFELSFLFLHFKILLFSLCRFTFVVIAEVFLRFAIFIF